MKVWHTNLLTNFKIQEINIIGVSLELVYFLVNTQFLQIRTMNTNHVKVFHHGCLKL